MKFKIWAIITLCATLLGADAEVITKKDAKAVRKGIALIKKQQKENATTVKLKRFFLMKKVKKPSIFSSSKPIYNLYLASFLQHGTPYWIEDDKFVLHTSSSQWYLKKLKKRYLNKYGIETALYKNPRYRQKEFNLTKVDRPELLKYLEKKMNEHLPEKNKKNTDTKKKITKSRKNNTNKVEKEAAVPPAVVLAKVQTKKEAKKVQRGIDRLNTQTEDGVQSVTLKKYFLAKPVQKPSFFSDKTPFYNLYLTAIINNGNPVWLEDTKFVFHTSSSKKYLKRLQRYYQKKYHLELTLYKNPHYKKEALSLAEVDRTKIIHYLQAQIPDKLKQQLRQEEEKKALKKQQREARKNQKKLKRKKWLEREKKRLKKEQIRLQKNKLAAKKRALMKEEARKKREKMLALKRKKEADKKRIQLQESKKRQKLLEMKAKKEQALRAQEQQKVLAQEQETQRKTEEAEREREKAKQEAVERERERVAAEKRKIEAQKKALEEERRKIEERKKALAAEKQKLEEERRKKGLKRKQAKEAEKRRMEKLKKLEALKRKSAAQQKREDPITSDLDKMLNDTKNFKKKLERSESIKYY